MVRCGYVECCMWLRGEFCKRVKLLNRPPPTTAFIIGVGNFSTDTIYAVRLFWLLPWRFSPIFAFYSGQFHFCSYYSVELSGYFSAHFYSAHCITITIFFPPLPRPRSHSPLNVNCNHLEHILDLILSFNLFSSSFKNILYNTWFVVQLFVHTIELVRLFSSGVCMKMVANQVNKLNNYFNFSLLL